MSKPFRIAVLASTRGTDLQAIIDEIKTGRLKVELSCVISNKADCYAIQRAKEQGFETCFVDPVNKSREDFDMEMARILEDHNVNLIVLVGYMRILSSAFVKKFHRRIINVHPALLPKFGGKEFFGNNVHEAVLKSGEKETGMTIHFVEKGVDTGEIILQKKIGVEPTDTIETLKEKVQALEKEWYPKVIAEFASGVRS
ncbi:MAG: phosphoribosylglycinamide formyltransferase [Patescibacteria group bacterium]